MSHNELQFPDDRPDQEIGDALRPLLTPTGAGGSRYWQGLEQRIMQRLAEERLSPWSVLAGWSRPAAVAAALLLAAASLLLTQLHNEEAAVSYAAMVEEQYAGLEASPVATATADVTVRMLLER